MIIEKLKFQDLDQYKTLMDQCFGNGNQLVDYQNNYHEEDENYIIFVAKKDDTIIGSMTCYKINLFTFSFQPAIELFNVAVLEEYRGQNVAKNLFQHVKEFACKNGYKSIYLTCLDTAAPAHKFYESMGFEKMNSFKYSMKI